MLAQLRSFMLTAGFVVISAFVSVTGSAFVALNMRPALVRYLRVWEYALSAYFLLFGVRITYEDFDKKLRGVIIAANHESCLDIAMGQRFAHEAAYWSKSELLRIPFFGSVARFFGMISVNRAGSPREAVETIRASRKSLEQGRCVFIFPEGTRRSMDSPCDYHAGIFTLYERTQGRYPVHVVVHNSGDFIKNRGDARPVPWFGTLRVVHAGIIDEPGLPEDVFMERLEAMIRTKRAQIESETKKVGPIGRWFMLRYLYPLHY